MAACAFENGKNLLFYSRRLIVGYCNNSVLLAVIILLGCIEFANNSCCIPQRKNYLCWLGGSSGTGNWDANCNPRSVTRRRRWIRKRSRRRELKQVPTSAQAHPPDSELPENLDNTVVSEGMVMILVLLCTLVRGSKLQESRVRNPAFLILSISQCVLCFHWILLGFDILLLGVQSFSGKYLHCLANQ